MTPALQPPPRSIWLSARVGQRGYALLVVLWLVAVLSIMVASMTGDVRLETRQAAVVKNRVEAMAVSEAAIRLELARIVADAQNLPKGIARSNAQVFGVPVAIEIIPLNGYIDLNNASQPLLADMFRYAGEQPEDMANELASRVLAYRLEKESGGRPRRFHGIEELLRIRGVDYRLYAKIENLLTTGIDGAGLVSPMAAPEGVLRVLAKGDVGRARQIANARNAGIESVDTSTLTANLIENTPTSYLEIRALAPVADRAAFGAVWQVDVAARAHGLPWRVLAAKSYNLPAQPEALSQ